MKFVKITDPTGVVKVDTFIKRARNANGNKLSPEIAMKTLTMTNHYLNIRFLVKEIYKLPPEERLEFKDFVASALCRREHKKDNLQGLLALAEEMGILEQLEKNNYYNTGGDFNILYPYDASKVKLGVQPVGEDISGVDECYEYYCLRNDFSESDCIVVDERNVPYRESIGVYSILPRTAIFKGNHKIVCMGDCSKLERMIVDDGVIVYFDGKASFCDDFRFPKCERIVFDVFEDLSRFKHIKDLECREISFYNCVIPKDFDFSKFEYVRLESCDLSNMDKVEFKENSVVRINSCKNLAKVLDFSKCAGLDLCSNNDFKSTEEIVFRDLFQGRSILRQEISCGDELTALSLIVQYLTGRNYSRKTKKRLSSFVKHCKISYVNFNKVKQGIMSVFGAKEKGEM